MFRNEVAGCPRHFGFLRGIHEGALITKECLVCSEMSLCMLRPHSNSSVAEHSAIRLRFPVVVKCKQWEDFKALACGAETVSFLFKQEQKIFQADALKDGKVLTYAGEFPQDTKLLKLWLSNELNVIKEKIVEGVITGTSHQTEEEFYCHFCGIEKRSHHITHGEVQRR